MIITYHDNEKLGNVLHTIHSILQRTPDEILEEIILVDDNSQKGNVLHFIYLFGIPRMDTALLMHINIFYYWFS